MPTLEAAKPKEKRARQTTTRSFYPRLWTSEEFLDWLQPRVYADLIHGQVFMHSPATFRHSSLLSFLECLLMMYLEQTGSGRVYREANAVRFNKRNAYLPDLMYFTKDQAEKLRPDYADFAPTWIVEALSKRTAKRDTGVKFAAYEQFGVQEYWIVDSVGLDHRFYRREGNLFLEFAQNEERIDAESVPGFYILRKWLDPEQRPSITDCLREIFKEP